MAPKTRSEIHAETLGYGINTLPIGQRVELHPATDLWMRGARFGEIVGFPTPDGGVSRKAHMGRIREDGTRMYSVKLDKQTKRAVVSSTNLRPIPQGIR